MNQKFMNVLMRECGWGRAPKHGPTHTGSLRHDAYKRYRGQVTWLEGDAVRGCNLNIRNFE
jgi:hypothetical protein